MQFTDQQSYEAYYSPEQRERRRLAAQQQSADAIKEALSSFEMDEVEDARQHLLDAGFDEESIAYYLRVWRN